jgi:hypothetical protein
LTALTVGQVDVHARVIAVDRHSDVAGHLYIEAPKNRKRRQTIYPRQTLAGFPLADRLAARIRQVRAEQAADANPLGLVFPFPKGKLWRSSGFIRQVLQPAYRAGRMAGRARSRGLDLAQPGARVLHHRPVHLAPRRHRRFPHGRARQLTASPSTCTSAPRPPSSSAPAKPGDESRGHEEWRLDDVPDGSGGWGAAHESRPPPDCPDQGVFLPAHHDGDPSWNAPSSSTPPHGMPRHYGPRRLPAQLIIIVALLIVVAAIAFAALARSHTIRIFPADNPAAAASPPSPSVTAGGKVGRNGRTSRSHSAAAELPAITKAEAERVLARYWRQNNIASAILTCTSCSRTGRADRRVCLCHRQPSAIWAMLARTTRSPATSSQGFAARVAGAGR